MTGEQVDEAAAVQARARTFPGLKGMDLAKVVSAKRSLPVERGQHLAGARARADPRARSACTWSPTTTASSATSCACSPISGCRMTVVPAQTSAARGAGARARRRVPLQRPRRSGALRLRHQRPRASCSRPTCRCSASASATRSSASPAARSTVKMKFGHHGANHPVQDLGQRARVHHQPESRLRGR